MKTNLKIFESLPRKAWLLFYISFKNNFIREYKIKITASSVSEIKGTLSGRLFAST